ncbi:MAG: hypothetical protein ACRDS0_35815 [Pseudonocardiaceae bacterium]
MLKVLFAAVWVLAVWWGGVWPVGGMAGSRLSCRWAGSGGVLGVAVGCQAGQGAVRGRVKACSRVLA